MLCTILSIHKRPNIMARIQDIHNLEESICDAVEEYLDNTDGYRHPVLRVYYDKDLMLYCAEMDDNLEGSEDDGIYAIDTVVRDGDDGFEPDNDAISDIANSWLFLG